MPAPTPGLTPASADATSVLRAAAPPEPWIHIPTPGDHYSPAAGSAVMTVTYELTRQHMARGGKAKVIVGRGTRHDYPVGECAEVDFGHPPPRSRKLADVALARLGIGRPFTQAVYRPALDAVSPDYTGVIFVHNAPAAVDLLRRHAPDATICLYCHNDLFRTYARREVRAVVRAADRVIAVSEFLANVIRRQLGADDPKIVTVHNGVDTDRFQPADPPPRNDPPVILFLGRLQPIKGPDILLRAANILRQRGQRFRIRFVGSVLGSFGRDPATEYERDLLRLAEPLGDDVEFVGFTDRHGVVAQYQGADIFCAPSNWDEPFGLTVVEALACGLPVVAARRGGIPEAGGDAALYFEPPDAEALAGHVANLINDEAEQRKVATRGRERAVALSWRSQYQRLRGLSLRRGHPGASSGPTGDPS